MNNEFAKYDPMNNPVYKDAFDSRSENDKDMIKMYNCKTLQLSYPQSIVSMLPPAQQSVFKKPAIINPSIYYQLNPTPDSIQQSAGNSVNENQNYPPRCGFFKNLNHCERETPYAYPTLPLAYNPTVGYKYINLGQDLNLQ